MSSILDRFRLDGKVAIVTGASRGLGQGYAQALAEAGADVVLVDVGPSTETEAQIRALGRKTVSVVANLADRTAIPRVIAEAKALAGRLDILVNNAGIIRREEFEKFSEKDWDDVMNVNLNAVFFLSQAFVRDLVARKSPGKIINIASMLSFQGGIRVPSYTASKSAVMGLTRLMANELAAKGITINAIAPGYIATANTAPSAPTRPATRPSSTGFRRAAGAPRTTSRAPWSSSPRRRPTTSTATRSRSTAAGLPADPRSRGVRTRRPAGSALPVTAARKSGGDRGSFCLYLGHVSATTEHFSPIHPAGPGRDFPW